MSNPSTFNLLPLLAAPPAASEAQPQDFIPFHILIADHLAPALSPPLLPVGHLTPQLLAEVHAFNMHLVHDMQDRQAFDLYPMRSGNLAQVNLRDVKCVAFREDVVKEGQVAMSRAMDRLIWFMRGRGALPIKKCKCAAFGVIV